MPSRQKRNEIDRMAYSPQVERLEEKIKTLEAENAELKRTAKLMAKGSMTLESGSMGSAQLRAERLEREVARLRKVIDAHEKILEGHERLLVAYRTGFMGRTEGALKLVEEGKKALEADHGE